MIIVLRAIPWTVICSGKHCMLIMILLFVVFCVLVMREVVAVGRAHGVDLAADYAELRLKLADEVAYDMTSSMHHDLERGNPLEVRWLSGGVVELGQSQGVPTPLNRAIADILALHAKGRAAVAPHGAPHEARA